MPQQNVYFLFSEFLKQWFDWNKKLTNASKCSTKDCPNSAIYTDGLCHNCKEIEILKSLQKSFISTKETVIEHHHHHDGGLSSLPDNNNLDDSSDVFIPTVNLNSSNIPEKKKSGTKKSSNKLLEAAKTLKET